MHKHIKASAKLSADKRTFDLTVEITHTGDKFGGPKDKFLHYTSNDAYTFTHKCVCLGSWHIGPTALSHLNWLNGPNKIIIFPNDTHCVVTKIQAYWWKEVKEAIEAYNEFYSE